MYLSELLLGIAEPKGSWDLVYSYSHEWGEHVEVLARYDNEASAKWAAGRFSHRSCDKREHYSAIATDRVSTSTPAYTGEVLTNPSPWGEEEKGLFALAVKAREDASIFWLIRKYHYPNQTAYAHATFEWRCVNATAVALSGDAEEFEFAATSCRNFVPTAALIAAAERIVSVGGVECVTLVQAHEGVRNWRACAHLSGPYVERGGYADHPHIEASADEPEQALACLLLFHFGKEEGLSRRGHASLPDAE